jgi:hypothetical protein
MSIILRTSKNWLTYWGQLMSHDLHWPQNTWSVIIHRSLTKSKYRFWVVDWFEFPIYQPPVCMNDQFRNFEHDFPFEKAELYVTIRCLSLPLQNTIYYWRWVLSRSADWLFVNSTSQLVIYPVNGKIFVFKWGFLPSPFWNSQIHYNVVLNIQYFII